jgi:hypothetical protein
MSEQPMSIFEEMYPYRQFGSWRDFEELKRMLGEAIARGFVEEVPVMKTREVPIAENWYRDKETGDIYSHIPPEPPARGAWERIDIEELKRTGHLVQ